MCFGRLMKKTRVEVVCQPTSSEEFKQQSAVESTTEPEQAAFQPTALADYVPDTEGTIWKMGTYVPADSSYACHSLGSICQFPCIGVQIHQQAHSM